MQCESHDGAYGPSRCSSQAKKGRKGCAGANLGATANNNSRIRNPLGIAIVMEIVGTQRQNNATAFR